MLPFLENSYCIFYLRSRIFFALEQQRENKRNQVKGWEEDLVHSVW